MAGDEHQYSKQELMASLAALEAHEREFETTIAEFQKKFAADMANKREELVGSDLEELAAGTIEEIEAGFAAETAKTREEFAASMAQCRSEIHKALRELGD